MEAARVTTRLQEIPAPTASLMPYAGYEFRYRNEEEFRRICQDVFDQHEYAFRTHSRSPLIIDAGAHVGTATHYFKRHYPQARVRAFEANPVTFGLLQENIRHNRLTDVQATHAALAPEAGTITFYTAASDDEPGAWGDSALRQAWHQGEDLAVVEVPAVTLSSLLTEPVALLKLDIEGMETAVLEEALPRLHLVEQVILEFHGSEATPENTISRVVNALHEGGLTADVRQFGHIVSIPGIQYDEPYWLMVHARRLNSWQKLRRLVGR
jgi:FkbM family methyltransferase